MQKDEEEAEEGVLIKKECHGGLRQRGLRWLRSESRSGQDRIKKPEHFQKRSDHCRGRASKRTSSSPSS